MKRAFIKNTRTNHLTFAINIEDTDTKDDFTYRDAKSYNLFSYKDGTVTYHDLCDQPEFEGYEVVLFNDPMLYQYTIQSKKIYEDVRQKLDIKLIEPIITYSFPNVMSFIAKHWDKNNKDNNNFRFISADENGKEDMFPCIIHVKNGRFWYLFGSVIADMPDMFNHNFILEKNKS